MHMDGLQQLVACEDSSPGKTVYRYTQTSTLTLTSRRADILSTKVTSTRPRVSLTDVSDVDEPLVPGLFSPTQKFSEDLEDPLNTIGTCGRQIEMMDAFHKLRQSSYLHSHRVIHQEWTMSIFLSILSTPLSPFFF